MLGYELWYDKYFEKQQLQQSRLDYVCVHVCVCLFSSSDRNRDKSVPPFLPVHSKNRGVFLWNRRFVVGSYVCWALDVVQ